MSDVVCRLCGAHPNQSGGWLTRVNEKGVDGIWECRPSCDADLSQEDRLIGALEHAEQEIAETEHE